MNTFIVGVGRAGCRIGNLFFERRFNGVLIDTDESDLVYFKHKYKVLLGERLVGGNGTGGDLDLGREIMQAEAQRVIEKINKIKGDVDCFLVISAMGGGTGGAVDLLLQEMKKGYIEPIYYAGVLPSEGDQSTEITNFFDNFKNIFRYPDAVFPLDTDTLKGDSSLRGSYNSINERVSKYLGGIFEIGRYKSREELGANVVGPAEIINTLSGISTVGMGEYHINEKFGGIFSKNYESIDKPELIVSLTEEAVNNTLMPLNIKDSRQALVVVSGPKKYHDFLGSIPARLWVDKKIGGTEVRGGDVPSKAKKDLEVLLVLSGIKKSNRIGYLYHLGKMLKAGGYKSKDVSLLLNRFRTLRSKFSDIEEEFNKTFSELEKTFGREGKRE